VPFFTMTNVIGRRSCAADHSPWIEYMLDPSPSTAINALAGSGKRHAYGCRQGVPSPPLAQV